MNLVIDANAILALFHNEPGGVEVGEMIDDPNNTCYMHAVNLCEVYYDYFRTNGMLDATSAVDDLSETSLIVREDMDKGFWHEAGTHKAVRKLSLADCFCLTLARRLGARLITADHEFDPVARQGIADIQFIR
ncbi:MAG: type II toxin-antitoxin system VapC family toxin [Armatimonadetes bacterium]|nr:type II toxin-antitoxin system VapC family toxin [Armatimonadota bacterium]